MYKFFGVEWDIHSAVFWIVIAQAVFILIAVIIIIVLAVRGARERRERKERERMGYRVYQHPANMQRGVSSPGRMTQIYTTPELADSVEQYVADVLEKTKRATDEAAMKTSIRGPVYYTELVPRNAQNPAAQQKKPRR